MFDLIYSIQYDLMKYHDVSCRITKSCRLCILMHPVVSWLWESGPGRSSIHHGIVQLAAWLNHGTGRMMVISSNLDTSWLPRNTLRIVTVSRRNHPQNGFRVQDRLRNQNICPAPETCVLSRAIATMRILDKVCVCSIVC